MHHVQALALRRLLVVGAGLALTIVAHAAAVGHVQVSGAAPAVWTTILIAALLCGSRGSFVPRGWWATFAALACVQMIAHVVLIGAPWLLGLAAHHHEGPVVDARALAVHAAGALVFTALLRGADRLLAAAVAVVRKLVGSGPRSAPGPHGERVGIRRPAPPSSGCRRAKSARGPPLRFPVSVS